MTITKHDFDLYFVGFGIVGCMVMFILGKIASLLRELNETQKELLKESRRQHRPD